MINCRNCIHWVDESLDQIEASAGSHPHMFQGCRIHGHVENNTALESCPQHMQSRDLFAICTACRLAVPKVCLSLGECANCTDTDLFCVDNCMGGDSRRHCTHFVRLHTEGLHLVDQDRVFHLFPAIGMPAPQKDGRRKAPSAPKSQSVRTRRE
jgi:hypothetical protein